MTIIHKMVPWLILLWLSIGSAVAVEIKTPYAASVAVSDRSQAEQASAVRKGLGEVLVRISGSSQLLQLDAVKQLQRDAARYVVQYGYHTRRLPDYSLNQSDVRKSPEKGVFLDVKYDASALKQFLRRNGLPIWSNNRPPVIVWLALDQGRKRTVMGSESLQPLGRLLQDQAQVRGLPLVIPEYDETDQMKVSPSDIWGLFSRPIMSASARYQANIVLAVKVSEQKSGVTLRAVLDIEGNQQTLSYKGDTLSAVTQVLIQAVTDRVSERYAVTVNASGSEQIVLDVTGVARLQDYAALMQYLDGLIAVKQVQLQLLQGNHVRILLQLDSDLEALEKGFRVDRKLRPRSKPVPPRKSIPPKMSDPLRKPDTIHMPDELNHQDQEVAELLEEDDLEQKDQAQEGAEIDAMPAEESLPVIYYQWRSS